MTETPLCCWPELRHGPAPEQACTLYTPSAPGPWPLVLCIHGGGWILGRRFGYNRLAMPLAQQGFACATLDYRKLDANPWPAPIDDCLACLDLLRSRSAELDIDPENLALVGDSAGGHLALLMAPSLCPKAVVGISAPCDLRPPLEEPAPYAPLAERAAAVSPVLQAEKGFPPTLLIHGEQDELVHIRQAYGMRDRLTELGAAVELKTFPDGKHSLIWDQEADVQAAMQEFLLGRLSPAATC